MTYSVIKLIFSNIQDCNFSKLRLTGFGCLTFYLGFGLVRGN
jgi:hypothetical protein